MSGSGNAGLPTDGHVRAQDAVGSGGRASSSSASAARSFDFMLTGPMWGEFTEASNAYGRGVRRILLPFIVFFGVVLLAGFLRNGTLYIPGDEGKAVLCLIGIMAVCLFLCWGRLDCSLVLHVMFRSVSDWFAVPSTSTAELTRVFAEWRADDFDSRWNTPCRLTVDADGVVLERWVRGAHAREGSAGRRRVVRASWSQLDCVRLTEHAVVLSPSAGGKASIDIIPAVADVRFADLDGCVLVDRSVVSDVEGFVAWCRERIAAMAVPLPSRGLCAWVRRFWSWLYGDREFLDGPPACAAK
ncbi:hypothetical protein PT279_06515 [Bifidobacterium sp. ESL0784]|uniref:hypothetical protein n=1 Tax=Bifidobacterium sp. ESL0784 TaxID=2983231 RepID=UPI0023F6EA1A|nr:hypothetical protein [Bifidobacterium sp. ESL0784]MDF7641240.1 hypothetical protein [Bifidobacterium sp. ESL0784]